MSDCIPQWARLTPINFEILENTSMPQYTGSLQDSMTSHLNNQYLDSAFCVFFTITSQLAMVNHSFLFLLLSLFLACWCNCVDVACCGRLCFSLQILVDHTRGNRMTDKGSTATMFHPIVEKYSANASVSLYQMPQLQDEKRLKTVRSQLLAAIELGTKRIRNNAQSFGSRNIQQNDGSQLFVCHGCYLLHALAIILIYTLRSQTAITWSWLCSCFFSHS